MVQKKNGSMMLNVQSQNVATPLVYRMSGSTPIKSITLGQGKQHRVGIQRRCITMLYLRNSNYKIRDFLSV